MISDSFNAGGGRGYDGGLNVEHMQGLMDILGCSKEADESTAPNLVSDKGGKVQAGALTRVAPRKPKKEDKKAIWAPEDFKAASGVAVPKQVEDADDRPRPKYDILHRQKVGSADTYMNLQEMDASSDSCSELLVKIWLPDTQLKDISVDVLEDRVLLQAPKYRLNLALPHKVRKDSGNAKWDKLSGLLSVVIPIEQKIKYFSRPEEAFVNEK